MIRVSVIGLALVFFGINSFAAVDDTDQGWKKTNLNYRVLRSFIDDSGTPNQYPCYANTVNFLGCVHLINGLGSSLKPVQSLLTREVLALSKGVKYTVVKDFGPLLLVKIDATGEKPDTTFDAVALTKQREKLLREVSAKYVFAQAAPIDFDALSLEMINALPPTVSQQRAIAAGLNDLISVHDGHGHIDAVSYLREQEVSGDKSIFGIGATLNMAGDNATVVNLIKGSPAEKAGIKRGDRIVTVDDHDVKGLKLEQIVSQIRGERGTPVRIQVWRDGAVVTQAFTIVRDQVNIANVEVQTVQDMGAKYIHIKLNNFMDRTACDKIDATVQKLPADVRGVIMDVRSNPGGLLDQVVCIGGIFVGQRAIAFVRSIRDGKTDPSAIPQISNTAQKTALPVVVLIDNMSASASEILAGAIQDYKRGWLVGTRTFGKATVQAPRPLVLDPSIAFFQTIARFYEPSGRTSQIVGISPDFETYATPSPSDTDKFGIREEDITPAALPPEGRRWEQTRQAAISQLEEKCLKPNHRAEDVFKRKSAAKDEADYPLLKAQEVLACDQGTVAATGL